ncbi:DUF3857 domain-containing protein [Sediminibacterium sp.]|uniref:DUF3857 domain-containing protein n=1 Tax=Sediminibacterium sp. TaxID=1917865 RepID=UPI0025F3FB68|nr:DUF3857 domain-containing protein [Sediminibacterium sp.]MBW0176554.1 DUF3857 domain-containing protein [Sediminibacterium sp.]
MPKYLSVILLLFALKSSGQEYAVSLIPDSLKENADVIKRIEEVSVTIRSTSKALVKHKYAITILNENGDDYAGYMNGYTKLISLSDISGKLFDAEGKLVRSIKRKDIADMSVGDDASLLTDLRSKSFSFYHKTYPYTVEFEDEQVYDGIFFLPKWTPVEDEKMAVQFSRFSVEVPNEYVLRYRQFSYQGEPLITQAKNKTYVWDIKGYKAIIDEVLRPAWRDITPTVYIAPTEFEIGEYKGNMATWKTFGQFINQLNAGRGELPEQVKQAIKEIAGKYNTTSEKVAALYEYLQKNTRYISIQLGIGSWQPFDAKYVATNKYGDCKALSNYMVSILKEAGIRAHYVLINAGEGARSLVEEFPSPNFNHAIACVPNGKDTIWLECTSQTVAPGFMGSFTGNRKALVINEEGGHVVSTRTYSSSDNQQIRKVEASIDKEGNLKALVKTLFTGEQQELQLQLIHEATEEQRKNYLNRVISLPTYKVLNSVYKQEKQGVPRVYEELNIESPGFTSVSGKRLFIQPNLFNKYGTRLPETVARKYPVVLTANYADIDTVIITIPDGYTVESIPKPVQLKNDFGEYAINFSIAGNNIEMIRSNKRVKKTLPPASYTEIAKYFDAIRKADNGRVVFVKKE